MGQISKVIINGILNKPARSEKTRRRKLNPGKYQREMEEYLHSISYRYLGTPPPGNRWFYPDIRLWDENEDGDNVIPAFVSFYLDQSTRIRWEVRSRFKFQLQEHIPPTWDLYWYIGEGFVHAERRIEDIPSLITEGEREYLEWTEKTYDTETLKIEGNGHKELGDEDAMLVVREFE